MTGTKWATATATAVLLVATQAQAITDADKCEAAKNKVSGKYLLCRLKADAKAAQTGAPADYLKCSMKFDEKWDLAETKYGASCPDTVGASGPMDALLTSQATRVAAIVAGTQDIATCGNGILDPGEECDDGNLDNADGCSGAGSPLGACQVERCGDGVVNNGEPCDPLDTPATCNLDCSLSVCGDGKVNPSAVPPEQCDDGNNNPGDGCHECRIERCGNGVLDQGEECDGVVNAGAFGCSPECFQIQCGNGRLDAGEQCDDGNNSDTDSCLSSDPDPSTCRAARCGDGFVWAGVEQCDDGAPNTYTDACLPSCQLNVCGDGFLKTTGSNPEACDDGNIVLETGCPYGTPTCVGCTEDCSSVTDLHGPFCGDGNVDVGYGEECDDGNNTSGDGCSATCQLEF